MDFQKIKLRLRDDLGNKLSDFSDNNNFELKKLPGKRNLVYEVEFLKEPLDLPQKFVLKIYKNRHGVNEYNTLSQLYKRGINVPRVIHFEPPLYLLLEKINGINFTDFINNTLLGSLSLDEIESKKKKNLQNGVRSLARWVSEFHRKNLIDIENHSKIIVLNKGDSRLKDFIYSNSSAIFGLDFESSYSGNYLDDLAWIACSFLDTNPGIFEMDNPKHKVELINLFLEEYHNFNREFNFSFNYFAGKLIENLNIVIRRRSLDIGKLNKEIVLRKFEGLS